MDKLPRIGDWATYDELAARQRAVLSSTAGYGKLLPRRAVLRW